MPACVFAKVCYKNTRRRLAQSTSAMASTSRVVKTLSLAVITFSVVTLLHAPLPWKDNSPSTFQCPPKVGAKIVSVVPGGRLGNLVWEYLSVWAMARRHGLYPAVPRHVLSNLSVVFANLSVPAIEDVIMLCGATWLPDEMKIAPVISAHETQVVERVQATSGVGVLLLRKYEVSRAELRGLLPLVRDEMKVRPELAAQAQSTLRHARRTAIARLQAIGEDPSSLGPDYVGIHVRRTDYIGHLHARKPNLTLAGPTYFHNAMQEMRAMLGRPVFVVASDDVAWCRENLEPLALELVVAGSGHITAPGPDLALLAACNHTIFAYGTFGLTGATLAGGYTIMYTGKQKDKGMKILKPNHTLNY